jgi:quinol monooxygenase YgiN
MDTRIAIAPEVTTLINILTVEPERHEELLKLLKDNTDNCVSKLDGWISTSFIAANDHRRIVIYSQWRDLAAVDAMRANIEMQRYFPRIVALASFDGLAGDVVYTRHTKDAEANGRPSER